jgi:hypothetical protein
MVLLAVADSANSRGEHSHPGFDNVARCALYSRRQAITLLAQLVEDGWLEVEQLGGGAGLATVYRLPKMKQEKGAMAAPKESAEGCNMEEETVQYDAKRVQSRLHPNGLDNVDPTAAASRSTAAPADTAMPDPPREEVLAVTEEDRRKARAALKRAKGWEPPPDHVALKVVSDG